jgi:hypothetical protein
LAIEGYQQGYLLQCYDNGRMNKFDVSVLLSRKLDKKYKNGFNIKTNNKLPLKFFTISTKAFKSNSFNIIIA